MEAYKLDWRHKGVLSGIGTHEGGVKHIDCMEWVETVDGQLAATEAIYVTRR